MTCRPPSWTACYRLGRAANQHVSHEHTLQEVADELGISKQNAYTESVVALGKLLILIRQRWNIQTRSY